MTGFIIYLSITTIVGLAMMIGMDCKEVSNNA